MKYHFQIPEPCHEDWNQMTPTQKGRFCNKCSKEVLDLRALGPEIAKNRILQNSKPCIRIEEDVLGEMNFREWLQSLSLIRQLRWAFVLTVGMVFGSANAQEDSLNIIPVQNDTVDSISSPIFPEQAVVPLIDSLFITIPDSIYPIIIPEHPWGWGELGGVCPDPIVFEPLTITSGYVIELVMGDYDDPKEDVVSIDGNEYTFKSIGDTIQFNVESRYHHTIKLTAKADPTDSTHLDPDWRFFIPPISLDKGHGEFILPMKALQSGRYLIHIETTRGKETAEILL